MSSHRNHTAPHSTLYLFYSPLLGREKKSIFSFSRFFFIKKKNCDGVEAKERVENEKKVKNKIIGWVAHLYGTTENEEK